MNIVVCIKQVPASSKVLIDPKTGVMIRDGNNVKMNPYDLYAVETALAIKDKQSIHVSSITMGPPSAKSVIDESIWMGCDNGYVITDRNFAGADVVATSYTLSQGIKKAVDFDLIICGKQTTDGDTAQVGPEIAEFLNIPHISYVEKIIEVKSKSIVVQYSTDDSTIISEMTYPCLITVDKGIHTPRLPSFKRKLEQNMKNTQTFTLDDFDDKNKDNYGLKGSPTQVEAMFTPEKRNEKIIIDGTAKEQTEKLIAKLIEIKAV